MQTRNKLLATLGIIFVAITASLVGVVMGLCLAIEAIQTGILPIR